MRRQPFRAGQQIGFEPGATVLCVCRGSVIVTVVDREGNDRMCVLREAGSVVGLEALHEGATPYEVWALSEGEACPLPIRTVRSWVRAQGATSRAVVAATVEALRTCLKEHQIFRGDAGARLAGLLLAATGRDRDCSYLEPATVLSLPRGVLARLLGMRPETLSRRLRRLAHDGIIDLGRTIRVRRPDALRDIVTGGE